VKSIESLKNRIGTDNTLIVQNEGDFEKWFDRLIVSQGAKYWRWY